MHCWSTFALCCGSNMAHKMFNTLRPRQNGRHFADDIFKCISLNENIWIELKISLKFVPEVWISNIPALVQIMVWRRSGDKPFSGTMMVCLLMHICVTLPQWVNIHGYSCWHSEVKVLGTYVMGKADGAWNSQAQKSDENQWRKSRMQDQYLFLNS